jgi:hypothetical protein
MKKWSDTERANFDKGWKQQFADVGQRLRKNG